MADTSNSTGTWGGLIEMPQHQVMQVTIFGLVLGAAAWIIGLLVKHLIIIPLFCGDPSTSVCVNDAMTSDNVAAVVVAIVGLMGLVRLSVYRPLIIVLAVLASLWGIGSWTAGLVWYDAVVCFVVLYALAILAFTWLVRPRSFAPMIVMVVIAVVLLRWLPML